MPRVALAGGLRLHIVRAVIDGQMQRVNTRTTKVVRVGVCENTCRCVRLSVPDEAFAGRFGLNIVGSVIDGQVQGIHACTT